MARSPFRRALGYLRFARGAAVVAHLCAACHALLFLVLLVLVGMALDLVVTGGDLVLHPAQADRLRDLAGIRSAAATTAAGELAYEDRGLLPLVWRSRDQWYGGPLSFLYRHVLPLRDNLGALTLLVAAGLAVGALRSALLFLQRAYAAKAVLVALGRLRHALHRQILRLGPSEPAHDGHAAALHLFGPRTDTLGAGMMTTLAPGIGEPIKLLLLVLLVLAIHFWLGWAMLLLAGGGWFLLARFARRARERADAAAQQSRRDFAMLEEGLSRIQLLRAYLMEEREESRFVRQAQRYRTDLLKRLRNEALLAPLLQLITTVGVAVVVWIATYNVLVSPPALSAAASLLIYVALASAYWPVVEIVRARRTQREAAKAAADVLRYLDRRPVVAQQVGAVFLPPMQQELRFDRVSLKGTGGEDLLHDVSFVVPAGAKAAVMTLDPHTDHALVRLLPRFMDPTHGKITIDGHDIAAVTLESLRAQIGLVLQDDLLITATVAENIGCGDTGFSQAQIIEAAKLSHAHQFIARLPQGYETIIGEQGMALDPGQCFRIGLARAALRDPAILVIEEPCVPLADDVKQLVDDTFDRLLPGRTAFFLPRRLSTLRRCDFVLVLHHGRLEASARHEELVRTSDLYRHLQYLNFNSFRHEAAAAGSSAN